jgi:hypothetical protein
MQTKKGGYHIAILACLAALVLVVYALVRRGDHATQTASTPQARPRAVDSLRQEISAIREEMPTPSRSASALDVAPKKASAEHNRWGIHSVQTPDGSSVEGSVGADNSVVGRPFPVSPSVVDFSKSHTSTGGTLGFAELWRAMSLFEQEPREMPWAQNMERQLRDFVVSDSSGKATVRNIECRLTLCIVESSAAHVDDLSGQLIYAAQRSPNIQGVAAWNGYEKDESVNTVYVVLTLYCRPPSRTYLPC